MVADGTRSLDGCPVRARGLRLRADCDLCSGQPQSGQVRITRGDRLYLEGQAAEVVYLVITGYLRETRSTEDGRTQGIRLVKPGDITGSEALVRDEYQCSVQALTPVRACRVAVKKAQAALQARAEQGCALSEMLSDELVDLRDQVILVGAMTARERVIAILTTLTGATGPGEWTKLPLTRAEIAALLGLAQATVSRVIQRLVREDVLEVRGRRVRFV